ncbi:MAG: hypothetical protein LBH37_04260 [Oscillospiraceae bacterium]|nr:hypothetical protein [Oscillospiraceae bacterium]
MAGKKALNRKKISRKILIILSFLVFSVWFIHQISQIISSSVSTEMAIFGESEDIISAKGYIIRREFLIELDSDPGSAILEVKSGQRICKGGTIAVIYKDANDAFVRKKIKILEDEIKRLKNLSRSRSSFASSPNEISKQICSGIRSISFKANNCRFQEVFSGREKLLELLNERQIVTGKIENFDDKVSQLKKEKEELSKNLNETDLTTVQAPEAGNFVDHLDGFENKFDLELVTSLKPGDLDCIQPEKYPKNKNILGKIVSDASCHVCFCVERDMAEKFNKGMNVSISIPTATSQKIPAEIISINWANKKSGAALVCSCDHIDNDLAKIRGAEINISFNKVDGVKIPRKALCEKEIKKVVNGQEEQKNTTGVFVLYGNKVIFKEVIILSPSEKEYIICKYNPDLDEVFCDNYLKIYDKVVTRGIDLLYDGKIVK